MISLERVLMAVAVQHPDRVPFMEGGIDWQIQVMRREDFTSDGNLMPILDDLLALGVNGLHPI